MTIILSVFLREYRGKTVDFQEISHCHRTTAAYFLNHGKWNHIALQNTLKSSILQITYNEALNSGHPIYCIVDDTIASHTRPSSQAVHPVEAAYFYQSHLKGCQDYGHQIVREIAEELPVAPVVSYFLCDSWYASAKVMDSFIRKGFYTVGTLKTNRILYPCGIRQRASVFALYLRKTDPGVSLVTVGGREFYVYRYEGELNDIPNAAVILSYPKEAFGYPKALRVFLSTYISLSTLEILETYTKRWPIELFFRQSKSKLDLDKYQIRSCQGIGTGSSCRSSIIYAVCMRGVTVLLKKVM